MTRQCFENNKKMHLFSQAMFTENIRPYHFYQSIVEKEITKKEYKIWKTKQIIIETRDNVNIVSKSIIISSKTLLMCRKILIK